MGANAAVAEDEKKIGIGTSQQVSSAEAASKISGFVEGSGCFSERGIVLEQAEKPVPERRSGILARVLNLFI